MKRFLCLLFLVVFLPVLSLADLPDISSLTYDELVQLKDQINLAMWNSEEWQEVAVPEGVWIVGEDIPIGHWSMTFPSDSSRKWVSFTYCDMLDESGTDAGNQFYCKIYSYQTIGSPDNDNYPGKVDINLKPGTYIVVNHGPIIFTPYSGKPDLGFK